MQIALNTYSLRKEWTSLTTNNNYMPIVKFIQMLDGVKNVELLDRSFKSDPKTLKKIQEVFKSHGISVFSLGPHLCPLVGKSSREKTIQEFKYWIDMAADHGISNFRISLGGGKNYDKKKLWIVPIGLIKPNSISEAVDWTIEVLKPVVEYGEQRNVNLCIETHHRYSSNPDFQDLLLSKLPSKHLGFIFDIGNFESRDLSWRSLDTLIKHKAIKYMHAKTYEFDALGFETTLDYPKAIEIMEKAGLDINLSIEWEGKMPTYHGILHTYELCKYSIAKSLGKEYIMQFNWDASEIIEKKILQ